MLVFSVSLYVYKLDTLQIFSITYSRLVFSIFYQIYPSKFPFLLTLLIFLHKYLSFSFLILFTLSQHFLWFIVGTHFTQHPVSPKLLVPPRNSHFSHISQPFSLFLIHRIFNLTPSCFAIQATTPLTPSLYFFLLPSLLLLLKILVSALTNFLSSLHYDQSSIYVYIYIYTHFLFPFSLCPPPLYHLIHSSHYSTSPFPSLQHTIQLTTGPIPPVINQLPLLLPTYLCLSSQLPFSPPSPNFLQSFVYFLLLLSKSQDGSPSPSRTPLTTAPVTSYSTVSFSTDTVTVTVPPPVTSTLHFHTTHCVFTAPAPDVIPAPQVPKFYSKITYSVFPIPINTNAFSTKLSLTLFLSPPAAACST